MKRSMLALAPLVLALVGAGCASSGGAWSQEGFAQEKYGWKADYPPGQTALMGSDWRLDNWEKDMNGGLAEKTGAGYVGTEDLDHDGAIGVGEQQVVVFDLKFVNVHNNGVIWVQTRKLEESSARKDLDVLLENYVEHSLGYVASNLKAIFSTRTDVKLGQYPAVSALIELRSAKESPPEEGTKERFRKLHVVLTRFDYLGPAEGATDGAPSVGPEGATHPSPGFRPRHTAVLVLAYANDSDRFDGGVADFAKLLATFKLPDPPPESKKKGPKKPRPSAAAPTVTTPPKETTTPKETTPPPPAAPTEKPQGEEI